MRYKILFLGLLLLLLMTDGAFAYSYVVNDSVLFGQGITWVGGITTNSTRNFDVVSTRAWAAYNLSIIPFLNQNSTVNQFDFDAAAGSGSRAWTVEWYYVNGSSKNVTGSTSDLDYEDVNVSNPHPNVRVWKIILSTTDPADFYARNVSFRALYGDIVNLLAPADGTSKYRGNFTLNASLVQWPVYVSNNVTNVSFKIWNNQGTLIYNNLSSLPASNQTIHNISLPYGLYKWNAFGCFKNASIGNCQFAVENFSLISGPNVNSLNYSNLTYELSSEVYTINITFDSEIYNNVAATFYYNGISYIGTKIGTGDNVTFSSSLSIPTVNVEQNITGIWAFSFFNNTGTSYVNSSSFIQTVRDLSVDNCTINNLLILNYTLKDEDSRGFITPAGTTTNTSIQLSVYISPIGNYNPLVNFSMTYNNTNPASVCINSATLGSAQYRLDAIAQYASVLRATEFNYIQNFTLNSSNVPRQVDLYDLLITNAQEFLITFKDSNFLPIADAIIDIKRQYVGPGQTLSVEVPKTDITGKTLGNFVLSDVIYDIVVSKEGVILASFSNQRVYCQDITIGQCELNLFQGASVSGVQNFKSYQNVSYYTLFNQTSRAFTFVYFTIDGTTKTIDLNMTAYNGLLLNQSVCQQSVTSASGTLTCTPTVSVQNKTLIVTVEADNVLILTQHIAPYDPSFNQRGVGRFLLAAVIIASLTLMGVGGGLGIALVFFVMSLVFVALLNLVDFGGFFGPVSAFVVIVLGVAIIVYQMQRREASSTQI